MTSDGSKYNLVQLLSQQGPVSYYKGQHHETKDTLGVQLVDLPTIEDTGKDIQRLITQLCHCDSPYVPKYHKSFINESDQNLWVITEHVHGVSLAQQLEAGTIPEVYIAIILREVLRGLKYLHGAHLCHRNVKAANVVLTHGRLKLINLGYTTKYIEPKGSKHGSAWAAPEVLAGAPFTEKADIWAVGILAIELATGELPKPEQAAKSLSGSAQQKDKDEPPRLHGDFSRSFKEFVATCLVKDPAERVSARALLRSSFIRRSKNRSHLNDLREMWKAWKKGGPDARSEFVEKLKEAGSDISPMMGSGGAGKTHLARPDKRMSLPAGSSSDGEGSGGGGGSVPKKRGGSFLQVSSSPKPLNLKKMSTDIAMREKLKSPRSSSASAASRRASSSSTSPLLFSSASELESNPPTPPDSPTSFTRSKRVRSKTLSSSPPDSPYSSDTSPRSVSPPLSSSLRDSGSGTPTASSAPAATQLNGSTGSASSNSNSGNTSPFQSTEGGIISGGTGISAGGGGNSVSSASSNNSEKQPPVITLSSGATFLSLLPQTEKTVQQLSPRSKKDPLFHASTARGSSSSSTSSSHKRTSSSTHSSGNHAHSTAENDIREEPHMVKNFILPALAMERQNNNETSKAISKIRNSFEQLERADRETLRCVLINLAEAVHRDGKQPAPELLPPTPLNVLKTVPVDNLLADYLLNRWMSRNKI